MINPVLQAVMRQDLDALRAALAVGADIDARDRDGGTPLMHAVTHAPIEIVKELISHGADVNAHDSAGWTALHFATQEYRPDVAELLLNAGADVDALDTDGNTPLSGAVFYSNGRGEMIRLLLRLGADKTLANHHGVSPEDLATSIGNYSLSPLLE
jgi:ankyrin repeat protein